jgi:ATP-dependent Clp protease ATP-binding subunit ClpA
MNVILDQALKSQEAKALETRLRALVVGQDEAIEQVVSVYEAYVAGLVAPGRPIGNFLFLGPTGFRKTRMVEAVAESLGGNPRAVAKIDCAEFQHRHEIAKLIGSPPGYLGHRETHALLQGEASCPIPRRRARIFPKGSRVCCSEVTVRRVFWRLLA